MPIHQGAIHTRAKGNLGENVACLFLERRKFEVIARNYMRKWGEIDIVAIKDGMTHFFEVKSVIGRVLSPDSDAHRPEENVHALKLRRIRRMIETYMAEHAMAGEGQGFAFHVICVYMDPETRKARVKWIPDVIL